jgi:DNA (cytosine-5)-methyltransferase 1
MANSHPDLICDTRDVLSALDLPYVIENVEGAHKELRNPVTLCGSMFGLRTYRHRLFEVGGGFGFYPPRHPVHVHPVIKMGRQIREGEYMHVVGNFINVAYARSPAVMGMPWATRNGLREAIPPAYTAYIGKYLMSAL